MVEIIAIPSYSDVIFGTLTPTPRRVYKLYKFIIIITIIPYYT